MTAKHILFPLDMSQLTSTPTFKTLIVRGKAGRETRAQIREDVLHVFNASFAVKTYDDIETLKSFFLNRKGRKESFLVKDFTDYNGHVGTGVSFSVKSDDETDYQAFKRYTDDDGNTFDRNLTKFPTFAEDADAIVLSEDLVAKSRVASSPSEGLTYVLDPDTGLITYDMTSSTNELTLEINTFYVPVRFDIDELPIQLLTYWVDSGADVGIMQPPEIPLIEVVGE